MALYARRRRGTTPAFWRGYNNAQTLLAESTMKSVPPGFRKETSIAEQVAGFERSTACWLRCCFPFLLSRLISSRQKKERIVPLQ
jgi:hypothetical protein